MKESIDKLYRCYDAICHNVFVRIAAESADVSRICFKNFNPKDEEHQMILAVTMACISILDKEVAVDCWPWARKKLNKRYNKITTIDKIRKTDTKTIDTNELVRRTRTWGAEICEIPEDEFSLGDIYYAYYAKQVK